MTWVQIPDGASSCKTTEYTEGYAQSFHCPRALGPPELSITTASRRVTGRCSRRRGGAYFHGKTDRWTDHPPTNRERRTPRVCSPDPRRDSDTLDHNSRASTVPRPGARTRRMSGFSRYNCTYYILIFATHIPISPIRPDDRSSCLFFKRLRLYSASLQRYTVED